MVAYSAKMKFAARRVLDVSLVELTRDLGADAQFPVSQADLAQGGTFTVSGHELHVDMTMRWRLEPLVDATDVTLDVDLRLARLLRGLEALLPQGLRQKIPNLAEELLSNLARDRSLNPRPRPKPEPATAALAAGFELGADGTYRLSSRRPFRWHYVVLDQDGVRIGLLTHTRFIPWSSVEIVFVTGSPAAVHITIDNQRGAHIPGRRFLGTWPYEHGPAEIRSALAAWQQTYGKPPVPPAPSRYHMKWQSLSGRILFDGYVVE